jgi:hypothetical protein
MQRDEAWKLRDRDNGTMYALQEGDVVEIHSLANAVQHNGRYASCANLTSIVKMV